MTAMQTGERLDLSAMGFEFEGIPCESLVHEEHGTGVAAWVVRLKTRAPICNHAITPVVLVCDGCWSAYQRATILKCQHEGCASQYTLASILISAEPL